MTTPPVSMLPPGAECWSIVNDVAIRTGKDVRTIENWCEMGLFHSTKLAGGYGGVWVAVTADGWPVDGPGVAEYQQRRSDSARRRAAALAKQRPQRSEKTPPKKRSRRLT